MLYSSTLFGGGRVHRSGGHGSNAGPLRVQTHRRTERARSFSIVYYTMLLLLLFTIAITITIYYSVVYIASYNGMK